MEYKRDNIRNFEDISSYSSERPQRRPETAYDNRQRRSRSVESRRPPQKRPARPPRRPEPDWEIPDWELSERNRRPRAGPERTSSQNTRNVRRSEQRPVPPRKRPKKPMSRGARKFISSLIFLIMAGVTALLAIFLLFKITDINVTGNVGDVYEISQIIELSGCKSGDNLVFMSTRDITEKLESQLPYVAKAEVIRHLPNTVEIKLTKAQVAACMSYGGEWLYLSTDGKILEKQGAPAEGALQIVGLTPISAEVGAFVLLEDDSAQTAYTTILSVLSSLGMSSEFTRLDLSNLSDISMLYQDRIEFKLGNILELEYKISLGCRSVAELASGEKGVMDLSYADETKRAIFTAGTVEPSASLSTPESTPENIDGDTVSLEPESESPQSSGRGDEIPDGIFTGEQSDSDGDYWVE